MKTNFESQTIPLKVLKWGKVIIIISFIIIFIIVFLLKYPDKITGTVIITTKTPPITLFPKISGEIESLNFNEGDTISKGNLLCVIKNTSKYQDVLFLEKYLNDFDEKDITKIILFKDSLKLGVLQTSFINFANTVDNSLRNENENFTDAKINILKREIHQINNSNSHLSENKKLLLKELNLGKKNFERYKSLHSKGVISDIDIENREAIYLQQKRKVEDIEIQIYNDKIKINQLENQIISLKEIKLDETYFDSVKKTESYKKLKEDIDNFKEKYLITSPISGIVSMKERRTINQYILQSQILCVIIPNDREIVALGSLPVARLGKLNENSLAIIKLENYPSKEFGVLTGEIKNISLLQQNNNTYSLEINLLNKLSTSYGLEIKYSPEMKGNLEVILEKRSLFEKLVDEIRNGIYNQ